MRGGLRQDGEALVGSVGALGEAQHGNRRQLVDGIQRGLRVEEDLDRRGNGNNKLNVGALAVYTERTHKIFSCPVLLRCYQRTHVGLWRNKGTSAYLQELQDIGTLVEHLLQLVEDDVVAVGAA